LISALKAHNRQHKAAVAADLNTLEIIFIVIKKFTFLRVTKKVYKLVTIDYIKSIEIKKKYSLRVMLRFSYFLICFLPTRNNSYLMNFIDL